MKQNVIIFIDGENFFRSIKDNFFNYGLNKKDQRYVSSSDIKDGFDLVAFCKYLTRSDTDHLKGIYFYDARLGHGFPGHVIAKQNKYLKELAKKGITVRVGKVENNRQKGTDVYLATDLLTLGWKKEYQLAILLSNDKDFRPAVEYIQKNNRSGKQAVQYTHFHHGYCFALAQICSRGLLLRNGEIHRFCSASLQKKFQPRPK